MAWPLLYSVLNYCIGSILGSLAIIFVIYDSCVVLICSIVLYFYVLTCLGLYFVCFVLYCITSNLGLEESGQRELGQHRRIESVTLDSGTRQHPLTNFNPFIEGPTLPASQS